MYCWSVVSLSFNLFISLLYFQPELYGVDWEGPTSSNEEHAVTVDDVPVFLTDDQKAALDI